MRDILKKGNRYLLVLIIFIIVLFACKHKEEKKDAKLYMATSLKAVGQEEYTKVYKAANDSLNFWAKNRLQTYLQQTVGTWQLDSLICFNKKGNKCVMAILVHQGEGVSNSINHFYGAKINGNWYFYRGAAGYTTAYSRDVVQTFAQLHDIAMDNIFRGYLITTSGNDNWEINDRFFDEMENKNMFGTYGAYPMFKTFEEGVMNEVRNNWKEKRKKKVKDTAAKGH